MPSLLARFRAAAGPVDCAASRPDRRRRGWAPIISNAFCPRGLPSTGRQSTRAVSPATAWPARTATLSVPRALFEMQPVFLSILGAPASGKSYFLASMTWRLRQVLPKHFALNFGDADPGSNHRLQEYEALQFLNPNQDSLVAIEKTANARRPVRHGAVWRPGGELSAAVPVLAGAARATSELRRPAPAFAGGLPVRQRGRKLLARPGYGHQPGDAAPGLVAGAVLPVRSDAGHAVPSGLCTVRPTIRK